MSSIKKYSSPFSSCLARLRYSGAVSRCCSATLARTRRAPFEPVISLRSLSSFPPPKIVNASTPDEKVPQWLKTFNENMSLNMAVTIPTFLVIRNGTWYALAFLYGKYLTIGPEFAIAYLMVKLTGKFRRPVDIALAAVLSKAFPVLGQVKVSALFTPPPQDESIKNTSMGKFMSWMSGPMDKYGFSFYISCKLTSFASIAGIAAAVRYGVDISAALTYFGVPDIIQDASAAFGVATMTNILLIPLHFALVAKISPIINAHLEEAKQNK